MGVRALTALVLLELNWIMNAGVLLWARSELRRRWASLVPLAILVAVAGGASIAAAAAARRTETAFDRMLDATNQPNITVLGSNDEGFFDLDPSLLDRVMKIEGVRGASAFAFVAVAPEGFPNYFAIAIVERRGEALRPILLEGASVDNLDSFDADEIVLNEAMNNELGKGAGDTVVLTSLTPEQFVASLEQDSEMVPAGPTMTARIAAVIRSPEDVSDAPDPFVSFPPAFYEKYRDAIGGCLCNVLISADPRAIDSVTAALEMIYPGADIQRQEDLTARIADTVALQRRTWWLISLAAALAGVVVLSQASTRAARGLLAGSGARRALGLTRRGEHVGRLLVITPPILVGVIAAIGVAYALSSLAPVGLTKLAEPSPGHRWEQGVVVLGALIVLMVSLIVVGLAVGAVRVRVERLRTAGRLGGPEIALGNRLAVGPGRGAILGVMLSTAALVGALTLERSIDHVLATPALYGADFDASNFLDSADDKRTLGEQLATDADVEAVGLVWDELPAAPPLHVDGPRAEVDVDARAFESIKGTVSVRQTHGRTPSRPDEVAVGQLLMNQLGARIGDRITATGRNGDVQLTIVGDNLDPGVDVAGQGFAMTIDGLFALTEPIVEGAVVRFAPDADRDALLIRYSSLGFTAVTPPSEVGHIGQLGGLPGRVGQLLAVLCVAALLNTAIITIRAGRREVGLHRALGFTGAQVVVVHLWQSAITAIAGVGIGGIAGFIVGRAIDRQLVGNVGAVADIVVPSAVWVIVICTVGVCIGAGALTGALALRIRPGRVLRVE